PRADDGAPFDRGEDPSGDGRATPERDEGRVGLTRFASVSKDASREEEPPVMTSDVPRAVASLAERRGEARAARDFAAADALRDRIAELGWTIVDEPGGGWRIEPAAPPAPEETMRRVPARDVATLLDRPAAFDVSLHWVVEGWPEDVERGI